MTTNYTGRRNSNPQLLQELEQLTESIIYQSHVPTKTRRTASLAIPRIAIPSADEATNKNDDITLNPKPKAGRVSLSMLLYRTKLEENEQGRNGKSPVRNRNKSKWADEPSPATEKKGVWNWKPIRALTHITMQKLSCLFSVQVVAVQNLPPSMNGLRLSVCVRKNENKEGIVQTMPSRVLQGAAEFEETLFIKCHVYYSGNNMRFEPRPFLIYIVAEELDFGTSRVDLSGLIKESIDKSFEGERVRHWDTAFNLSGKAKGGELVLKLGFQIMEKDGGVGIYSQAKGQNGKSRNSTAFARKQSKTSFSVPKEDDNDVPDSEEKGFDILDKDGEEENSEITPVSSEVIKEVLQDQKHGARLTEVDSLAQQIKVLESMMGEKKGINAEKIRRKFLHMLEEADIDKLKTNNDGFSTVKLESNESEKDKRSDVFLPDLGKGLGCVVQTRNGGYVAAMNPLNTIAVGKDEPKLAMQISKPLILQSNDTGLELFQKLAAIGLEELTSKISSLMPLDELKGKTAEQIAFEGIASAINQGSAARTVSAVKSMVNAMNSGRKERILTGIWNINEETLTIDEILAFSMQKIENVAINALKIQADMAEEDSPFDVSPLDAKSTSAELLASAISVEDLVKAKKIRGTEEEVPEPSRITMCVVVHLRDPLRQYEAVGCPMIVLIHAVFVKSDSYEEERYKVESLQVGGIRSSDNKSAWDTEKHRLTALQWLVEHGMGKGAKNGKHIVSKGEDTLWSISSRVMADMWLKPIRNPDVKFTE